MKLTKEYIKTAEKDVNTLLNIHKKYWEEPRYKILKEFCSSGGKILSVGCACKEPLLIHASHAMDITPLSEKYLREQGWKGEFITASCDDIPYPDKDFDIVVCSEVIEHLPEIKDIVKTFKEVDRVGKKWIISTPNSEVILPKNQNPGHKQFFTINSIQEIIPIRCKIYANDHHIYMESVKIE